VDDGQDDGAPNADLLIGGNEVDRRCGKPGQQQGGDQRRLAADAVAIVAEDRGADWPRDEAHRVDGKGLQNANQGIGFWKEQLAEDEAGHRAVEQEIVPFDGCADRAGDASGLATFYVPGEHDVIDEGAGKAYLLRYGKNVKGAGWHSFDQNGIHFIGLVNVVNLKSGGLGNLGKEQLDWLENDVKSLSASTPIVVFAHIPLWSVYPEWGWATEDGARALGYLRRFGSVTVLNGHIHQIMQKVEGNVSFHTARSTAFPQPEPGKAKAPGPMSVPAGALGKYLGVTDVEFSKVNTPLAIMDSTLAGS
jgi:3',5'-cyclic AMP phosphodiesterase CpdA